MSVAPPVQVYAGDCLDVLAGLDAESADAVVTDPPYGLEFMGKGWDQQVPGPEYWAACLRVLKPGGHLLAFGGTRTAHRMACAIEDAGLEIRDSITWLYGSGFPKSLDVSKAIDKLNGRDHDQRVALARHIRERREATGATRAEVNDRCGGYVQGVKKWEAETLSDNRVPTPADWSVIAPWLGLAPSWLPFVERIEAEREATGKRTRPATGRMAQGEGGYAFGEEFTDTAPATDAARQWQGWGTALKPAQEPVVLARKPLAGTVAANVLAHGTGGINIDATRVGAGPRPADGPRGRRPCGMGETGERTGDPMPNGPTYKDGEGGRWPTNVVLSHAQAPDGGDACADGCVEGCPVAELDAQSGVTTSQGGSRGASRKRSSMEGGVLGAQPDVQPGFGDSGGASRFFPVFRYQAKAPSKERPKVDGVAHPTVKPLALMRWLVRLVTPPDGLVLDPFAGSGTTGEAAALEGFRAVLIERADEYLPLIAARLDRAEIAYEVVKTPTPATAGRPPAPVVELADPLLDLIAAAPNDDALTALWEQHAEAWTDEHTVAVRARLAEIGAVAA